MSQHKETVEEINQNENICPRHKRPEEPEEELIRSKRFKSNSENDASNKPFSDNESDKVTCEEDASKKEQNIIEENKEEKTCEELKNEEKIETVFLLKKRNEREESRHEEKKEEDKVEEPRNSPNELEEGEIKECDDKENSGISEKPSYEVNQLVCEEKVEKEDKQENEKKEENPDEEKEVKSGKEEKKD
jgi:hypothetical protein